MGNDGGSIPDRRDLVRTKAKAEQADKANQTRARWFFCALSKKKLEQPIVSCALGKLYNRVAIINYFLDKTAYGDGEEICGHLRNTRDTTMMVLTKNPIREGSSNDNAASSDLAMFVCPLSMKEMNGSQPFVYLATCGCVFSLAGLTTLLSGKSRKSKSKSSDAESKPPSSSDDKNKESESSDDDKDKEHCPQCNKPFYPHLTSGSAKSLAPLSASTEAPSATALPIPPADADIVMLNPSEEEAFTMRVGMEKKRLEAKKSRKEKKGKRKGGSEEEGGGNANGNKDAGDVVAAANGEPPSKRTKISPARSTSPPGIKPSRPSSHAPTPRSHTNYNKNPAAANINPALPSTARLIAQDLAAGDVNRKSKMTDAVRSLYHTEESKNKKETFMTRGTYTRF